SWLLARIFPTCETAALLPDVAIRLPSQFETRRADPDRGVQRNRCRHGDPGFVEEGAVGRVEVLDDPLLTPEHESGVVGRGVVVADDEPALAGSPDRERF